MRPQYIWKFEYTDFHIYFKPALPGTSTEIDQGSVEMKPQETLKPATPQYVGQGGD